MAGRRGDYDCGGESLELRIANYELRIANYEIGFEVVMAFRPLQASPESNVLS